MGSRYGYDRERYLGFISWGRHTQGRGFNTGHSQHGSQRTRVTPNTGVNGSVTSDLGEVPALDEVSGHVSSRLPVDHRGDVVPRHPGSRVSVYEICSRRRKRRKRRKRRRT